MPAQKRVCSDCNQTGHASKRSRVCQLRVKICSDCNESGHKNKKSRMCSLRTEVECGSCGGSGHATQRSQQCVNHVQNVEAPIEEPVVETEPVEQAETTEPVIEVEQNEEVADAANSSSTLNIAKYADKVPLVRDDQGSMNETCVYCEAKMFLSERVIRSSKTNPIFQLCCNKGNVSLAPLKPTPPLIARLLTEQTADAKEFRENIRAYNSALSFSSMGVNLDQRYANSRTGSYTFRIQGSVYHRIGGINPNAGDTPKFAQIYVYDAQNELDNRHSIASHVHKETLLLLQNLMHGVNPFVQYFKHMSQTITQQSGNEGISALPEIKMVFRADGVPDIRRYNRPTTNEVGLIIVGSDTNSSDINNRDIVIHQHNNDLKTINEMNQFHDPLGYSLLFPEGDVGWCLNLPKYEEATIVPVVDNNISNLNSEANNNNPSSSNKRNITVMQYYGYRLMYRPLSNHLLHLYGKLFHQYAVVMYDKMEKNRLSFIVHNQSQLRCEMYKGLQDARTAEDYTRVTVEGGNAIASLGTKMILPSTFIGGPRHMNQLYQDAISIVRTLGKPDYFITFTCNPAWPEIQRELLHNQNASDRPDICSRVFKLKLASLMDDLTKKHVLGRKIGYVYTIEFQKRGLPHAHILLIVHPDDKPNDCNDFDSVVSAEFPNPDIHPLAFETVKKHMLHGPCGIINPKAVCMEDGKCTKQYPKQFAEETTLTPNGGYPSYRRRNDGQSFSKQTTISTFRFDNRWVVPHNLYLCTKYDAHINVEICSSVEAIKYIYKYVYKGHDRASVTIEEENEVKAYIDARYVSAPEACWRLFSFNMHDEFPSHQRLAVHLEGEENVYYQETDNIDAVLERAEAQKTTLTAWFEINKTDAVAKTILYPNFPQKFVWKKEMKPRRWAPRKKGFGTIIGRVYNVSPRQAEKFYLRMLLYHVVGATSFQDMRTVNGVVYPTYQAAAKALGLLESDDQWELCIEEAVSVQSPFALRRLFCIIVAFCEPSDPFELWSKFLVSFSEDYVYQMKNNYSIDPLLVDIEERAKEHCLLDVYDLLLSEYHLDLTTITGFILPTNDTREVDEFFALPPLEVIQLRLIRAAQTRPIVEVNFNADQKITYDTILSSIELNDIPQEGRLFFVDGPGGTGKTFLFNNLLHKVRSGGKFAIAVASSGTASLLLDGGRTAHSTFKIPLTVTEDSMCAIKRSSDIAKLLLKTTLIVWDECSMISKDVFDAVDRTIRDVVCVERPELEHVPFGGIVVVFGGDFRQILPVIHKASRSQVVSQCINRSNSWRFVKSLQLRTNMRVMSAQSNENIQLANELQQFADYLLDVGGGKVEGFKIQENGLCLNSDYISISDQILIPGSNSSDLISHIYPFTSNTQTSLPDSSLISEAAILTPLNTDVEIINETILNGFPGDEMIYLSADKCYTEEDQLKFPTEFLNSYESGSLPPHILKLKVGAPIMILHNISPEDGLCNGTRLVVKSLLPHLIEATIIIGSKIGHIVCIPKIKLYSPEESPCEFKRTQFPVRLAFAMTINKSQGQTLASVGLYLPKPVFSHGQLYVALSRVRNNKSIKVLINNSEGTFQKKIPSNYTRNVVYSEAFTY